jgi:hypothetical protein
MRSGYLAVGSIMISCVLAGCDGGGGGEATATPENPQAGLDAIKKMQEGAVPTPKGMKPATEVPKK